MGFNSAFKVLAQGHVRMALSLRSTYFAFSFVNTSIIKISRFSTAFFIVHLLTQLSSYMLIPEFI
jgi:hypothetical protein